MKEEEELFELLVETPVENRGEILDRLCKDQPKQRARLERLLAAHNQTNPLDLPIASSELQRVAQHFELEDPPRDQTVDYRKDHEGRCYGPYTLERLLGEGGMGAVWVAKQNQPVKRRVALKLIKSGMDSREVLARFEHERQALAVMDHPSIARVLDGGLTEDGRPFFAMELVNGLPLTKFCDEAKLSTEERLDIFVQICSAVQHAHQKGIIHRDLKPGNILVTLIDGRAIPKVIDFGVSKALTGSLSDQTLTTQFGAVIGTLEYMAPEQAGYSGADVDTRADIYALGVILYELLTGLKPFDSHRLRSAAIDEMLRIIREEEPSKPSTRLSSSESRPSLAAARGLDPSRLTKKIRGDLDWIALKCLEKDRNLRYETANQLALEIKRYLADEPIMAGPPSAPYRLRKFLRRNRKQVAVAAMVVVSLLAGLAASLWQMNRAIIAERVATKARDDEVQQRRKAEELRIKAEENERKAIEGTRQAREALDAVTDDVVRSLFAKATKLTDNERNFFNRLLGFYDRLAEFEGSDTGVATQWMKGYWRVTEIQTRLGAYEDSKRAFERMIAANEDLAKRHPKEYWPRLGQAATLRAAFSSAILAGRLSDAKELLNRADTALQQAADGYKDDPVFLEQQMLLAHDRAALLPPEASKDREAIFAKLARKSEKLVEVVPENTGLAYLVFSCLREWTNELSRQGRYEEVLQNSNYHLALLDRKLPAYANLPIDYVLGQKANEHRERGRALIALARVDDAIAAFQQGLHFAHQREEAGLARLGEWDIVWNQLQLLNSALAGAYESQGKMKEAVASNRDALAAVARWSEYVADQKPLISTKASIHNDLVRVISKGGGSKEDYVAALLAAADYRESHITQFANPREYRDSIAKYRDLAANSLGELVRIDDALNQRRKSIVVKRGLIDDFPEFPFSSHVRNSLGWSYLDLALGLFGKKETSLGIQEIEHGIATFKEELARDADDPESLKFKDWARTGMGHAYHRMADHWWTIGAPAKARDNYSLAIEWETMSAAAHADDYRVKELLATAWHSHGECNLKLGDYPAGVTDFKLAIALLKDAPSRENQSLTLAGEWIDQLDVLAEEKRVAGKPAEALTLFRDVLAFRQALSARFPARSPYRQRVVWSIHNVCIGSIDAGKMEDALAAAKELGAACRDFGKHHGDKAEEVLNVSDTAYKAGKRLLNAGQTTAASELYAARLAIRVDLAERFPEKPSYLDAIMYAHYDLFKASWVEGSRDSALASMRKSIDAAVARRTKFPALRESHAKYDECVNLFCSTLRESKEYGLILELVREYRKQISKNHPTDLEWTSSVLIYGGRAALVTLQFAEAEAILRDALKSFEATIPNDWQVSNCRCYLGEAMIGQGKFDEANAMLVEGYDGLFTRRASIPAGNTSRVRIVAEMLRALAETRKSPEDVERWTHELKKLDGESPSAK